MGNPTNELRDKLDELDVKWWPDVYYRDTNTCWRVGDFEWRASEQKDGKLLIGCTCVKHLTPEQAIAATVGAGTLTAEQVRECAKEVYFEGYGDGATHRVNGIEETDWQTIADKLNATLGAGTCHFKVVIDQDPSRRGRGNICECDKCGYRCARGFIEDERFKHCPNCGKRIIEEGAE